MLRAAIKASELAAALGPYAFPADRPFSPVGVLLEAGEGARGLAVSAMEENLLTRREVGAKVSGGGRAVVPAGPLASLAAAPGDAVIVLEAVSATRLELSRGPVRTRLVGYRPDVFRAIGPPESVRFAAVDGPPLAEAIAWARFDAAGGGGLTRLAEAAAASAPKRGRTLLAAWERRLLSLVRVPFHGAGAGIRDGVTITARGLDELGRMARESPTVEIGLFSDFTMESDPFFNHVKFYFPDEEGVYESVFDGGDDGLRHFDDDDDGDDDDDDGDDDDDDDRAYREERGVRGILFARTAKSLAAIRTTIGGVKSSFKDVLPTGRRHEALVGGRDLVEILAQMAVIAPEGDPVASLRFAKGLLTVAASCPSKGRAEAGLAVGYDGPDVAADLAIRSLVAAVATMGDGRVALGLQRGGPSRPVTVTVVDPGRPDRLVAIAERKKIGRT